MRKNVYVYQLEQMYQENLKYSLFDKSVSGITRKLLILTY
jgi:hypothetical protein